MVVKDFLFACAAFCLFPGLGAIAQDQSEQIPGIQASTTGPVAARGESASFAQQRAAAVTAFSDAHPRADVYSDGTRITRVFGTIFGSGSSPRETAQQFRTKHAMMFGVEPEDLQPVDLPGNQEHGQPVMYDRQTGEYKFSLVSYGQRRNGVPVFRADLKLLVRNESGYPLVLAAANLRSVGEFSPALVDVNSLDSALWRNAAQEFVPSLVNFTAPELVIWAGVDDTVVQPALAVTFVGDNEGGANSVHLERWLFVADATTGEIVHREELVFHFCGDADDVVGNVEGLATPPESGADICGSDVAEPMPYARVRIGETVVYADENGDFCIPHEGTARVTVWSRVWGEFFRVHNFNGSNSHPDHLDDTRLRQAGVIPPGPANFTHNSTGTQFKRAEVNAFMRANEIRNDWVLQANPDYPTISTETEFDVNVNKPDPTNRLGWYTPVHLPGTPFASISLTKDDQNHTNTAFSSVVYHEYGHHVVYTGGNTEPGAYHEGMGDTLGVIILDDPCVFLGIRGNCSPPTGCERTADNNCQYDPTDCSTCGSQIHACGQLLSGCVWDTRNELVLTEPGSYQQILMALAVNSVLLHSAGPINPQITIDWLTLDDDNTCFWDGSPHYDEICTGFGAHSMNCPCLGDLNGDGEVEPFDLAILLSAWGLCPAPPAPCVADLNCDGIVDAADTALLLGAWGPCPGGGDGPSGGDGSSALEEALALMDYSSVDDFIAWTQSAPGDEVLEAVQYLHWLLTN